MKSYYFSISELVDIFKKKKMKLNDLKQMFSSNVNEMEEVYVAENRNKLTLFIFWDLILKNCSKCMKHNVVEVRKKSAIQFWMRNIEKEILV